MNTGKINIGASPVRSKLLYGASPVRSKLLYGASPVRPVKRYISNGFRSKLLYGASEVLQFAIKIEENGWEFYKKFADLVDEEKIRELFVSLADEEIKHKETFEAMLPEIEKYEPQEVYPPEYFSYLKAYADNIVFKKGIGEKLKENMDAAAILDFGIRMELDSIAYYQETKNFVPASQKSIIDRIIEEERKHFLKLANLKNTL